jgi:hypothetical protein
MNTLAHADIFFFISSIGFIVLASLGIVVLVYVVGILKRIRKISEKIGDNVEDISSDAKEFVRDIRDSAIYRMLFGRKKTKKG